METLLLKNGNNKLIKYIDKSGNEIKPERPSSRISRVVEIDFNPKLAVIENGNITKNEAREKEYDLSDKLSELYEVMVSDIYSEMYKVFGTRNDVSAQATASTYEAMVRRPSNYVGLAGLVDENAVKAYAESKIAESDAYGVYRLARIAKFQADRAALTK